MKIAVLGPLHAFGFGADLARELARRGHEVVVVESNTGRRVRTQCLTLYAREVASMRAKLREMRPDVVLAHWTYEYARAAVTSGFPCVVVAHDSPWRVWRLMREPRMLFRALYTTLLVLPKVRHLIAVSPHIVSDLRPALPRSCSIHMVPNGITTPPTSHIAICDVPSLENGNSIRPVATTILCVTEGNRLKNASAMTAAFEILKKAHPNWVLKMFVKGKNTVSRDEVMRVLREEADVFCSPSLEESFGMVFLEAMSCGVPCVGGEASGAVPWVLGVEGGVGVSEVEGGRLKVEGVGVGVEGCVGGEVCDVTKPEKLAECLERVMLDYELRKHLNAGGLRRARECFALNKVADAYLEVLENVFKRYPCKAWKN